MDKVPGVVVEDGLEVLDELLDDGLHDDAVIIARLHADHHRRLPILAKGSDEATLKEIPDLEYL